MSKASELLYKIDSINESKQHQSPLDKYGHDYFHGIFSDVGTKDGETKFMNHLRHATGGSKARIVGDSEEGTGGAPTYGYEKHSSVKLNDYAGDVEIARHKDGKHLRVSYKDSPHHTMHIYLKK